MANSASTGMLVVESIVPGGCAEGLLEPGDVVIRVQGRVVTYFLTLEGVLDNAVGSFVSLDVERGGIAKQVTLKVTFLNTVSILRNTM